MIAFLGFHSACRRQSRIGARHRTHEHSDVRQQCYQRIQSWPMKSASYCLKCFNNVSLPASCLFSSFPHHNSNINWKKHSCCAWDSNLGPLLWSRQTSSLSYGGRPLVLIVSLSFFVFYFSLSIYFSFLNTLMFFCGLDTKSTSWIYYFGYCVAFGHLRFYYSITLGTGASIFRHRYVLFFCLSLFLRSTYYLGFVATVGSSLSFCLILTYFLYKSLTFFIPWLPTLHTMELSGVTSLP